MALDDTRVDRRKTYSASPASSKPTKNFLGRSGASYGSAKSDGAWKNLFKLSAQVEDPNQGVFYSRELPYIEKALAALPPELREEFGTPEEIASKLEPLTKLYATAAQLGQAELIPRLRALGGGAVQRSQASTSGALGGSQTSDYVGGSVDNAGNLIDLATSASPYAPLRWAGNIAQQLPMIAAAGQPAPGTFGDISRTVLGTQPGRANVEGASSVSGDTPTSHTDSALGPALVQAGQFASTALSPKVMPFMMAGAKGLGSYMQRRAHAKAKADVDRLSALSSDPTVAPDKKEQIQKDLDEASATFKQLDAVLKDTSPGREATEAVGQGLSSAAQASALTGGSAFGRLFNASTRGLGAATALPAGAKAITGAVARGLPRAGLISTLPENVGELYDLAVNPDKMREKYETGTAADIKAREAAYESGKGRAYDAWRMASMPINYFANREKFRGQYGGALLPAMLSDEEYRSYVDNLKSQEAREAGYVTKDRFQQHLINAMGDLKAALPGLDGKLVNQLAYIAADRYALDDAGRLGEDDLREFEQRTDQLPPAERDRVMWLAGVLGPERAEALFTNPEFSSAIQQGLEQSPQLKSRTSFLSYRQQDQEAAAEKARQEAAEFARTSQALGRHAKYLNDPEMSYSTGTPAEQSALRYVKSSPAGQVLEADILRRQADNRRLNVDSSIAANRRLANKQLAQQQAQEQAAGAAQAQHFADMTKVRDAGRDMMRGHVDALVNRTMDSAASDARFNSFRTQAGVKPIDFNAKPPELGQAKKAAFVGSLRFIAKLTLTP